MTEEVIPQNEYEDLWTKLPSSLPISPVVTPIKSLAKVPSASSLYLKVLKPRTSLKRDAHVPHIAVSTQLTVPSSWLDQYIHICGWSDHTGQTSVPITAPQVLAAPLHMYLLTHADFPASALGIVHAANQMIASRPLDLNTPLQITTWTGDTRWKARGFEVDLHTAISQDQHAPSWLGKTTVFRSVKSQHLNQPRSDVKDHLINGQEYTLKLAANLGRLYAPIAGDYNPIHLYPFTAKLFGFKRPIIHGMWTLAHLLSKSCPDLQQTVTGRLVVTFRRPLPLPLITSAYRMQESQGHLIQAYDHRGKLAIDIAYTHHLDVNPPV